MNLYKKISKEDLSEYNGQNKSNIVLYNKTTLIICSNTIIKMRLYINESEQKY